MNTALVAYAGSAHLVMPITKDTAIIESFAAELTPEIMPEQGESPMAAIQLAKQVLSSYGRPGSILLISDKLALKDTKADELSRSSPVHLLAVAGDQSKPLPLGSPAAPALDRAAFASSASALDATLTFVTPDDTDVRTLSRHITSSFIAAEQADDCWRWMDMGYWTHHGLR